MARTKANRNHREEIRKAPTRLRAKARKTFEGNKGGEKHIKESEEKRGKSSQYRKRMLHESIEE